MPLKRKNDASKVSQEGRKNTKKQKSAEDGAKANNLALIFLNDKYTEGGDLPGVKSDGEQIKKILKAYKRNTVHNSDDIERDVRSFIEQHKDQKIERLHFHFSGHGVDNARIEAIKPKEKDATEDLTSETPIGCCMIGTTGSLYAVHDLQHNLLELQSDFITATLDCCRAVNTRAPDNQKIQTVKLKHKKRIELKDQEKIALLYGALRGHTTKDDRSLTNELSKVTEEKSICILDMTKAVNDSWKKEKVQQRSKDDILKVGKNWTTFLWPNELGEGWASNSVQQESSEDDVDSDEPTLGDVFNSIKQVNEEIKEVRKEVRLNSTFRMTQGTSKQD